MEKLNVKESLKHLKVIWDDPDTFSKYSLVIFFFTWPVLYPIMFLLKSDYNHFGERWEDYYGLIITILFLVPGILTLRFIKQNNKLSMIQVAYPLADARTAIEMYMDNVNFKLIRSNKEYLIAEKINKWTFGSRIVVIFEKNTVYLNVQNQRGYRGYSPFSFGRNKKIKVCLIEHLKGTAG